MPGTGTSGIDQPSTVGTGYGRKVFDEAGDSEPILPVDEETGSILLRADPLNSGTVYIGWDQEVSAETGMYMQPGDSFSVNIDNSSQAVYAVADEAGDEIRYLGTN